MASTLPPALSLLEVEMRERPRRNTAEQQATRQAWLSTVPADALALLSGEELALSREHLAWVARLTDPSNRALVDYPSPALPDALFTAVLDQVPLSPEHMIYLGESLNLTDSSPLPVEALSRFLRLPGLPARAFVSVLDAQRIPLEEFPEDTLTPAQRVGARLLGKVDLKKGTFERGCTMAEMELFFELSAPESQSTLEIFGVLLKESVFPRHSFTSRSEFEYLQVTKALWLDTLAAARSLAASVS